MKFGIHDSSWLDVPDPAEAFETVNAKAQWAEDHGFAWFSVLDHMIQIPRVGVPDEPFLEGWTGTRRARVGSIDPPVSARTLRMWRSKWCCAR